MSLPTCAGAADKETVKGVHLGIFHWLMHDLPHWVRATAQAHPLWVFPIAFFIAGSESFIGLSFIIPGTTLLVALGGVIMSSHIGLFPAWAGAALGAILGDWASWAIGFHYHHKIVHAWLFRRFEGHIEKGLHLFHNWGTWAIAIGRFGGPFRSAVPLVAGMSELEFRPFMIANVASALIWAYIILEGGGWLIHGVSKLWAYAGHFF
jgi:membrane protein DedA with SNARE-associated domain